MERNQGLITPRAYKFANNSEKFKLVRDRVLTKDGIRGFFGFHPNPKEHFAYKFFKVFI